MQIALKMSRRPTSVSVSRQSRSDIVGQIHSGIVGPPLFYGGALPRRCVVVDEGCTHFDGPRWRRALVPPPAERKVQVTRSSGATETLSRLVRNPHVGH